jgi:hypothetical protein
MNQWLVFSYQCYCHSATATFGTYWQILCDGQLLLSLSGLLLESYGYRVSVKSLFLFDGMQGLKPLQVINDNNNDVILVWSIF